MYCSHLIKLVVLKRHGFQSQKLGMPPSISKYNNTAAGRISTVGRGLTPRFSLMRSKTEMKEKRWSLETCY